ncbi:hypothetical protein BG000_011791 [Podila horticola]|nr:hypothetical protein BG000_011791 [Podila horticola]
MVSFRLALTILASLLVINNVSASFAVCAGAKDVSMWKTVYGFCLWNDDGQQAHDYGSTPRNDCIELESNGWEVQPMIEVSSRPGDDSGTMYELRVSRGGILWDFGWPDHVCKHGHGGRFRGLFFVCKDTGNGWCAIHQAGLKAACADYLYMGTDSLSCNPANRPTP